MSDFWKNVGDGIGNFFFGNEQQVGQDYTTDQQGLANDAFTNGQNVLSSWNPQQQGYSQYQNFLQSLSPGQVFNSATSQGAQDRYGQFSDFALGGTQDALNAQAKLLADQGGRQAAEQFNLGGPGGLYSGAAAGSIGQAMANPLLNAQLQFAGLRNQNINQMLGQNIGSQQAMLGLQGAGLGQAAQIGQGYDQMGLQNAIAQANLYGTQAGSYDTSAMFQHAPGLFDYATTILGGASAYGDMFSGGGGGGSPTPNFFMPTSTGFTPASPAISAPAVPGVSALPMPSGFLAGS